MRQRRGGRGGYGEGFRGEAVIGGGAEEEEEEGAGIRTTGMCFHAVKFGEMITFEILSMKGKSVNPSFTCSS